ncbi:helix-turn-helix domain-containing protein [Nanoarchaeota archaeon]
MLKDVLDGAIEQFSIYFNDNMPDVLFEDARALSERNKQFMSPTSVSKPQQKIVDFVSGQVAQLNISREEYIETLPAELREQVESAEQATQAINMDPLSISMALSAINNVTSLYLPILYADRQKPLLPGGLLVTAGGALIKTVEDLGAIVDKTVHVKGIVRFDVRDCEPSAFAQRFQERIAGFRLPQSYQDANVKVGLVSAVCGDYIVNIGSQNYSLKEATALWQDHDRKGGKSRESYDVEEMLGLRHVRGQDDQTITPGDLSDFLRYSDASDKVKAHVDAGDTTVPYDKVSKILRLHNSHIHSRVRQGKLEEVDGEVSLESLQSFMEEHYIRGSKWLRRAGLPSASRDLPKPRSEYVTSEELSKLYGVHRTTINAHAREQDFDRFKEGKSFLYNLEEVTPYLDSTFGKQERD